MLNLSEFGARGARPSLLIVHGLFGSARNWGAIARRLADDRHVVTVDMRNHGDSFHAEVHDYPAMAGDLAEVVAWMGGEVDIVGHSMGGKAVMQLALTHPDHIRRMVVADIAPTAYGHTQAHLIADMRGVDLSDVTTRGEADRRLAETLHAPALRAFLLQSLDLKSVPPRWKLNLDVLEREMAKIIGWPGTEGSFTHPVLFLTGAESDYVGPDDRATIKQLFPNAKFARIPGAGHWLHADKPREFEGAVRAFLGA